MKPLAGKVALVAGATRGAGRGIATALGEAGATVWCTGRTSRADPGGGLGRPETIEETAELVTAAGGQGIAARVDHLDEPAVAALFARVRRESGGLDILVNDIWGGEKLTEWGKPFWAMDAQKGLAMMRTAIHTHLITARHGVPLLVGKGRGLLVEVTDGDHGVYRGSLYYDLVKSTIQRLAFDMHAELAPRGVTALCVTPGFLRSEEMLAHFGVTKATWRDAGAKEPHFAHSETPLFVGRAVAALAADPRVARKGGRVWASWTLSDEYGFVDEDGARPHWGRHWNEAFGIAAAPPLDDAYYQYWRGDGTAFPTPAPEDG
ncbi:MAG TPA: SDR family oxidoreductase [Candidatus Thermoplasmatota archaeon]|nr:SDR family oxidoreductase [Candidatus Thermoplasmatota archaeon]